jgi:hypothetical protein
MYRETSTTVVNRSPFMLCSPTDGGADFHNGDALSKGPFGAHRSSSLLAFETGIYDLTQDEAPGLLHYGTAESQPVLLVRLQPPKQ